MGVFLIPSSGNYKGIIIAHPGQGEVIWNRDWAAYVTGWRDAKPINIKSGKASDVTNVPVCIRITDDADIGALCRADGYDVRFLDSDGTELAQYRKSFSVSSGQATGEFWVMIPTLPAAGKTIYCIYGNSSATDVSNSSVNPDILLDGDFEQWNSSTDLTYWIENLSGSSTVNREATEKTRGNYAARLDVDSSNSSVSIVQLLLSAPSLNKYYKISVSAKTNISGRSAIIMLRATIDSTYYFFDFVNLVWTTTLVNKSIVLTSDFVNYSAHFHTNFPSGNLTEVRLYFQRQTGTSASLYFDNATILRADSSDACDLAADSWYNQSSVVSWGAAFSNILAGQARQTLNKANETLITIRTASRQADGSIIYDGLPSGSTKVQILSTTFPLRVPMTMKIYS